MLFALDIGNTNIAFGIFSSATLTHSWKITTPDTSRCILLISKEIRQKYKQLSLPLSVIQSCIISSVVPGLTKVVEEVCKKIFLLQPIILNHHSYKYLPMGIPSPTEIGSDLVANCLAAFSSSSSSCIVVDLGTALTFSGVNSAGKILGVSILPGLGTANNALALYTAQLKVVPLQKPAFPLGDSTVHAIQAGLLYGYENLIEGMIRKIKGMLPGSCTVYATGGDSVYFAKLKAIHVFEQYLALKGLAIAASYILRKNTKFWCNWYAISALNLKAVASHPGLLYLYFPFF